MRPLGGRLLKVCVCGGGVRVDIPDFLTHSFLLAPALLDPV